MPRLPMLGLITALWMLFMAAMILSFDIPAISASVDDPHPDSQVTTATAAVNDAIVVTLRPTATRTPTPINIGNFVWSDLDHDGRQDPGEPGLPGVTVQLWNENKTQLIDQTTTNGSGNYTVVAPVPGVYRVRVILPASGDQFSPKDAVSGDDLLDSDINPTGTSFGFTDAFTLASNVISTTKMDAGIIRFFTPTPTRTPTPINIGNFIWLDTNGDGRQDAGEPGVSGVTVQLWNENKTQKIDEATTNSSGIYKLVAPLPGSYRVRVLLPANTAFTLKDQGDNQIDSDINASGDHFGFTDVFTLASNVISTTIMDAGLLSTVVPPTPTLQPTSLPGGSVELLVDGGFEIDIDPDNNQPDYWQVVAKSQDVMKCDTANTKFAYRGQCAYMFQGTADEKARLVQDAGIAPYNFVNGDTLIMQVQYRTNNVAPRLKVMVRAFYTNTALGVGKRDKMLNTVSTTYKLYKSSPLLLKGDVSKIKVTFFNRATGGKIYIDEASLIFTALDGTIP